jgi:Rrf2 family nitric oxide-sensitive transcriptional repressor
MMLTKYADYSVRVLMYLAARPGEKVPITAIADVYNISRNHLMKVSQNLARHGYIIGYRGKGGGIMLARPARNINLGQVLAIAEPNLRAPDPALLPNVCPADSNFHQILEKARESCLEVLSSYTLAELVSGAELISGSGAEHPRDNGTQHNG